MAVIITRTDKGAPLTHAEMDANLNNLNSQITTHEGAADPHPGYALESALGTAVSDAIDVHAAAADPHPGYALESSLGTAAAANVTTSATDTTTGRVLKVGDFGLGKYGLPDFSDFNSTSFFPLSSPPSRVLGKSEYSPTNKPGTENYWITEVTSRAFSATDVRFIQTATPVVESNSHNYIRYVTNSNGTLSFGAWKKIYNQANILGTVSQSSGVPTGAIIERGSNTNGEYVKFADGTLICSRRNLTGIISGYTVSVWTFPTVFMYRPTVVPTWVVSANMNEYAIVTQGGGSTSVNILSNVSVGASGSADAIAIGRWF